VPCPSDSANEVHDEGKATEVQQEGCLVLIPRTALFLPPPYQDEVDSGRLILLDGTVAAIRPAAPDDRGKLKSFFDGLSSESRQQRFLSTAPPGSNLVDILSDSSEPSKQFTLVVTRSAVGEEQIIGTGFYARCAEQTAEIAMAVDDHLQGKGIGTQLLERLALIAIRNGFIRFWAVMRMDNRSMIDVFRHSGFPVTEKLEHGFVEIDFAVTPTETSVQLSEMRDRLTTAASIRPLFKPNAVAVIGASRNPAGIGYRILDELVRAGFHGPIYPVNPKADEICSRPVVASVRDIPGPVDLAIIAVPRDAVFSVVEDCAARGVRVLVVITAGFGEVDAAGRALQRRLLAVVRGYGMRMVGPNCMGLLNTDPKVALNASFSPVFPPSGVLAMSSQSGAIGLAVLALATKRHLGLSTFVSIGNKADVSSNDLLQYWDTDNDTRVILLYLESFGNPRRFSRIARRVSRNKPIIAVKAGRSNAGKRAAGSHTAALASNDVAVDALFGQSGVIRAESLDELFDIAATLSTQPLIRGRRIGVVTNAGGPGILCADACEAGDLVIPEFSAVTKSALKVFLPAAASIANPVDMVASANPESYRRTLETVLASADIDALIVIYIQLDRKDASPYLSAICDGIVQGRAAGGTNKPVLACLMSDAEHAPLVTPNERIPVYGFPEVAARVLSQCARYGDWKAEPPGIVPDLADIQPDVARAIVRAHLQKNGPGWLAADEVTQVLDAFHIPRPLSRVVTTVEDAVAAAESMGFPVALKIVSTTLIHKTEAGGVRLNLQDAGSVRRAFSEMPAGDGVLVQQMISGGVELMAGMTGDPVFGPLLGFGLGGIHVEILGDVQFRITPVTDKDARAMVRGIRGYRLLQGYRGHPPADCDAVEDVLLRLSRLVEEIQEIAELDLNPLVALPPGKGCYALDARIRIQKLNP